MNQFTITRGAHDYLMDKNPPFLDKLFKNASHYKWSICGVTFFNLPNAQTAKIPQALENFKPLCHKQ